MIDELIFKLSFINIVKNKKNKMTNEMKITKKVSQAAQQQ